MSASLYARLPDVARAVLTSKSLAKIAEAYRDDPEVRDRALLGKALVDSEIFGMAKHASVASEVLPPLAQGLGRGLAYGTGIAAPIAAGGAYLLHRAKADAKETAENLRNQVLLSALGLGGIGAGLYGLKSLADQPKQASYGNEARTELLEKLATVGVIEDLISNLDLEKLSSEAKRMAQEIQLMNRDYGVELLYEAMK